MLLGKQAVESANYLIIFAFPRTKQVCARLCYKNAERDEKVYPNNNIKC